MLCTVNVDIDATGSLATKLPRRVEKEQTNDRRDKIAREMWDQYQGELERKGITE